MDDDADVVRRKKNSIKKPKTSRYPSLKGTDPKFRRNHRYALHGTMKALVSTQQLPPPPTRRRVQDWQGKRNQTTLTTLQKELKEGKRETV